MNFKYIFIIAANLLFTTLFAQSEQKQIKLLDPDTSAPIANCIFEYGSQKGVSNQDGLIIFNYENESILKLSHANYGVWTIDVNTNKEAVFFRKSLSINLYPVTVIGINTKNKQLDQTLKIQYSDRMQHDAAQILNQLPAFNSIRKSGNYGFDPVFRGFKYDQLNIVLNGAQSATAACPNRMDPPISQMAPNMIDRIEVLKGPYALRYGTGLGATINFIPTKLQFTNEPDVYGRASSALESNGAIVRGETQLGFSGKKHDISVFSSWSQGKDYSAGNGQIIDANFQRGSFGTDLGFEITSNQQIRMSAVYNRARNTDFPALAMDLRKDDTWLFNVRHDIIFTEHKLQSWNTTAFGSFVDHLMDNLLKNLTPRMLNASTDASTYNYGSRTEGIWDFNNSKLYAGADLRIEGAKGIRERKFLMGPNAGKIFMDNAWQEGEIGKIGSFVEYQIKDASFNYIVSGRLELNQATIKDPTVEFTTIYPDYQVYDLNPSISLGLIKNIGTTIKTGLWLGRAQRSGSLTERFINYFPVGLDPYEMLGNPEIKPEINNQTDVTFEWMPNKNTTINANVFASYIQDYISSIIDPTISPRLPMSPGVRSYININEAFKTGFEISWAQQLFSGLQHQLGIAYTYAEDLDRDSPLPEIAPLDLRYTLKGSYINNKVLPELTFRYVSEQPRVSSEFGETITPEFMLVDFEIGFKISKELNINMGCNNVLNENYYEHLNRSVTGTINPIFAPGRNLFMNLNYTF